MSAGLTIPPLSRQELRGRIDRIPRVPLALLPTPLEDMPRLAERLGGPTVLVKRDDLTGLALGGNKVRNLEFRMAEALGKGADTVIMGLDVLSNSARQTAAAANRHGLETVLVLKGQRPDVITGNLLVNYLLGARVVFGGDAAGQRAAIDGVVAELEAEGRRPWVISDSPLFPITSAVAYVDATLELLSQLDGRGVDAGRLSLYITSTGKGQPGLELAIRALGLPARVVGSAVDYVDSGAARVVADGVNVAADFLGIDISVSAGDIDNRDDYVGEGYGVPSQAGLEAIEIAARTDGLLLDPVYTGKGFAALIDDVRRGRTGPGDTSVFFHTGGLPLLFNLAGELGPLVRPDG